MKIQIEPHTLIRAEERGTNKKEIEEVLQNGTEIPAKYNKKGKSKVYPFNTKWQNKFYKEKKVEVFYIIENDTIITVTVYVYYGEWR